jgi:hypothetical protein
VQLSNLGEERLLLFMGKHFSTGKNRQEGRLMEYALVARL